jgi:hypothetical protein
MPDALGSWLHAIGKLPTPAMTTATDPVPRQTAYTAIRGVVTVNGPRTLVPRWESNSPSTFSSFGGAATALNELLIGCGMTVGELALGDGACTEASVHEAKEPTIRIAAPKVATRLT